MTDAEAIEVYRKLVPTDDAGCGDDPQRDAAIAEEIRGIIAATTAKEAAEVIEWWGWDSTQQMYGFIRRVKAEAKRMGLE